MKNLSRRTLILAPPLLWATSRIQAKAECASYTQIQVPLCQATQPPFGSRPATGPLGFSGQSNIVISNLFFNQFISPQELLEFNSCTNITIMDCDFDTMPVSAAGRRAIYLLSCSGTIAILRCRSKQPAHNFIQFDKSHMTGEIAFNKVRGATANSEDLISLFQSGGVDATHRLAIHNNALDGGDPVNDVPGYTSNSGSGMLLCDSAQDANTGFVDCHDNTLLNPGQVGIGVAGGNDVTVDNNIIYSIQTPTSNVGLYIWSNGGSLVCQNMEASGNRVKWLNSAGADNGKFQTGNCGMIANWANNNFSDSTIDPSTLVVNSCIRARQRRRAAAGAAGVARNPTNG